MENKNVFIAVALSMSVLLFWSAFFEPPKPTQQTQIEKTENIENNSKKSNDNGITPQINTVIQEKEISRAESIQKNKRVNFENIKISGSISLVGGVLDDLSFKNYKKKQLDLKKLKSSDLENDDIEVRNLLEFSKTNFKSLDEHA